MVHSYIRKMSVIVREQWRIRFNFANPPVKQSRIAPARILFVSRTVTVRSYTRKKHRESRHFIAGLVSQMTAARYYSREKILRPPQANF